MSTQFQGTVKHFNVAKGYGFIKREGFDDIFFHISKVTGAGSRVPEVGDHVSYDMGENLKGPCAINVRVQITNR